jgi:hypothetical protein
VLPLLVGRIDSIMQYLLSGGDLGNLALHILELEAGYLRSPVVKSQCHFIFYLSAVLRRWFPAKITLGKI